MVMGGNSPAYVHDINILYNNRMAAWIGYYRITPDIIVYFPHTSKLMNLHSGWQKCMKIMGYSIQVQKYKNSSHKALHN